MGTKLVTMISRFFSSELGGAFVTVFIAVLSALFYVDKVKPAFVAYVSEKSAGLGALASQLSLLVLLVGLAFMVYLVVMMVYLRAVIGPYRECTELTKRQVRIYMNTYIPIMVPAWLVCLGVLISPIVTPDHLSLSLRTALDEFATYFICQILLFNILWFALLKDVVLSKEENTFSVH